MHRRAPLFVFYILFNVYIQPWRIRYLDGEDDFNKRNCIHRLVLTSGRVNSLNDERLASDTPQTQDNSLSRNNYIIPAASPVLAPYPAPSKELDGLTPLARGHDPVEVLKFLLDKLRPHQRDALRARDSYGRIPLNYAAQYGLVAICQIITARMKAWGQFDVGDGIDAPLLARRWWLCSSSSERHRWPPKNDASHPSGWRLDWDKCE